MDVGRVTMVDSQLLHWACLHTARTCISTFWSQVQQRCRARYWTVKLHLTFYGEYGMDFRSPLGCLRGSQYASTINARSKRFLSPIWKGRVRYQRQGFLSIKFDIINSPVCLVSWTIPCKASLADERRRNPEERYRFVSSLYLTNPSFIRNSSSGTGRKEARVK